MSAENTKKIVSKLHNKPKIAGVTGFGHWSLVEKWIGKRDGKTNQICKNEEFLTTPYIEHKYNCLGSYEDEKYTYVIREMEGVYQETYANYMELKTILENHGENDLPLGEEGMRQAAHAFSRMKQKKQRKEQILVRLAQIQADTETVDEALTHNLQRAEKILKSHVGSYWKGILQSSQENLPPYPQVLKKNPVSQAVYENHKETIIEILNMAMKYDEKEE